MAKERFFNLPVLILIASSFMLGMSEFIMVGILPDIAVGLKVSEVTVGNLVSLFAFGGIYAASTFGWRTIQIGSFGILLAIAGTFGAWIGGKLDDRFGPKRVIAGSLTILLLALAAILLVDKDSILFVKVAPPVPGGPHTAMASSSHLPR